MTEVQVQAPNVIPSIRQRNMVVDGEGDRVVHFEGAKAAGA